MKGINMLRKADTRTLTTGIDAGAAFVGTDGSDTFNAAVDNTTAANNTLNVADEIDGGAVTDRLNFTVQGIADNDAVPALTANDFEKVFVRNVDATSTHEIE